MQAGPCSPRTGTVAVLGAAQLPSPFHRHPCISLPSCLLVLQFRREASWDEPVMQHDQGLVEPREGTAGDVVGAAAGWL